MLGDARFIYSNPNSSRAFMLSPETVRDADDEDARLVLWGCKLVTSLKGRADVSLLLVWIE
jgi:hypothetical protein